MSLAEWEINGIDPTIVSYACGDHLKELVGDDENWTAIDQDEIECCYIAAELAEMLVQAEGLLTDCVHCEGTGVVADEQALSGETVCSFCDGGERPSDVPTLVKIVLEKDAILDIATAALRNLAESEKQCATCKHEGHLAGEMGADIHWAAGVARAALDRIEGLPESA